jgi:hypothetical protein
MNVITSPSPWRVTLREGSILVVWASSYSVEKGEYIFDTLMQASPEEQSIVRVSARTPSDVGRVLVVCASIPQEAVLSVESDTLPGEE